MCEIYWALTKCLSALHESVHFITTTPWGGCCYSSLLYRWGLWGSERFSDLPKAAQLASDGVQDTSTRAWLQSLRSKHPTAVVIIIVSPRSICFFLHFSLPSLYGGQFWISSKLPRFQTAVGEPVKRLKKWKRGIFGGNLRLAIPM